MIGCVTSATIFSCLHVEFDAETRPVIRIEFPFLEVQPDGQMRDRAAAVVVLHQHRPGERAEAFTSAAVGDGSVKCGTMPTKCVSQSAAIFIISVMPPTLGSVART